MVVGWLCLGIAVLSLSARLLRICLAVCSCLPAAPEFRWPSLWMTFGPFGAGHVASRCGGSFLSRIMCCVAFVSCVRSAPSSVLHCDERSYVLAAKIRAPRDLCVDTAGRRIVIHISMLSLTQLDMQLCYRTGVCEHSLLRLTFSNALGSYRRPVTLDGLCGFTHCRVVSEYEYLYLVREMACALFPSPLRWFRPGVLCSSHVVGCPAMPVSTVRSVRVGLVWGIVPFCACLLWLAPQIRGPLVSVPPFAVVEPGLIGITSGQPCVFACCGCVAFSRATIAFRGVVLCVLPNVLATHQG